MNESPQKLQVVLAEAETAGRIIVDLEAFFQFNHCMTVRLEGMVERWSHLASPFAVLQHRFTGRPG